MRHSARFFACAILALALPATAQRTIQVPTPPWSGGDDGFFEQTDPTALGLNPAQLDAAAAIAKEGSSDSLLVIRNGQLALERYWNGKSRSDLQQMYSATKSPFVLVVGRAIERGYIKGLDQPIVELVPEIVGMGREVLTFRNILAMESGLEQSRALDEQDARDQLGQFEIVLKRSVTSKPFTSYHYNNAAYRLLFTALERASGKTIPKLTAEELFEPLGMKGARWVELRAGDTLKGYQSIRMRPIDLAKVGQIMLNNGQWKGAHYLPKSFLRELSTAPAPKANPAYGLFWHLNGGEFLLSYYESNRVEGKLLPGTPDDAIANYGSRGQVIVAIPSLDLVWIRTGQDIPSTIWENQGFISKLSAAIVAAIE